MARRKKSEKLSIEGHASATYSARSLHHLFFPTMTLHFVTIIAIIREEHFTDATTQWADIYIHSGSAYNRAETCAYTYTRARTRTRTQYTRSSTSKFFEYCADPERKSSSFASILLCVLTPRFRVANTFERSLRTRTDLIRASFSSSLRKYWTLELALVSYYPPVRNRI